MNYSGLSLSQTPSISNFSLYLEQFSRSLSIDSSLIFSLYLELSLSRTNSLVPCEFEIERESTVLLCLPFIYVAVII